jgi:hypothetical protein
MVPTFPRVPLRSERRLCLISIAMPVNFSICAIMSIERD